MKAVCSECGTVFNVEENTVFQEIYHRYFYQQSERLITLKCPECGYVFSEFFPIGARRVKR